MPQSQKQINETRKQSFKLIYNPNAGKKRQVLKPDTAAVTLEDIKYYLNKYQIPTEFFPTKGPGHATRLAREGVKEGFKGILGAGGDGTVGEVANGLIGSEIPLGIIPLGSFMNVARMLSIPIDVEKAVQLIKISRTRKVDVGVVTMINSQKLSPKTTLEKDKSNSSQDTTELNKSYYFLESAGVGLQAQLHNQFDVLEKGNLKAIFALIKTVFDFYNSPLTISYDDKKITTRASTVAVSNGSHSGASLEIAPKAKLNDHLLTITLFRMGKFELLRVLFRLFRGQRYPSRKIQQLQAKKVTIESKARRLVHVDGRVYGFTNCQFEIYPNALEVITGFPDPSDDFLERRTQLDP